MSVGFDKSSYFPMNNAISISLIFSISIFGESLVPYAKIFCSEEPNSNSLNSLFLINYAKWISYFMEAPAGYFDLDKFTLILSLY